MRDGLFSCFDSVRLGRGARRFLAACLAAASLAASMDEKAFGHAGHDHGEEQAAPVGALRARVSIYSETYELVGIANGDQLTIFLDKFHTNEPVADAAVTVTIGEEALEAKPGEDGAYVVTSAKFAQNAPLELIFSIAAASGDDLMIGMLPPSEAVAGGGGFVSAFGAQGVLAVLSFPFQTPILFAVLFVAVISLPFVRRRAEAKAKAKAKSEPPSQAVSVPAAQPLVVARSQSYDLIGVLEADQLSIFLDRHPSKEPVMDANLRVAVGDEIVEAELAENGAYIVFSDHFMSGGAVDLYFSVSEGRHEERMAGTLALPRKKPKQKATLSAKVLALALISFGSPSFIDPAHAGDARPAANDAPRRLSDGTVFVSKPTQRLLQVRTAVVKPEQARKAVTLIGRIIADPNRSSQVQSINGGRILAPNEGLPRIGQAVKKGDMLAQVERPLRPEEQFNLAEKNGEIEQQLALVEAKLQRARLLVEKNAAPQSQLSDFELELEGLKRRRDIVRQARAEPEILRAPTDGIIASARITPGQVVQAQDVLFQIIDSKGLWAEALVYGEIDPASISNASATGPNGVPLTLTFRGFSRALQQQAALIQFSIVDPPASISVGQSITVTAQSGAPVEAVVMPREAVVRSGAGEAVIWRHSQAERFEARAVRIEPFDGSRVVIRGGVKQGDRIVVQGAELINQIR